MLPRILWYYRDAMKNNRMSRRELKDLQLRKLRAILQFSYQNVAFYHRRLRELGLRPEDVRTLEDLKSLPLLTREEVVSNYPEGITARGVRAGLTRTSSGSTSGKPIHTRRSARYDDVQNAIKLRKIRMGGVQPWAKGVVFQFPWSPFYDGRSAVLTPSTLVTILTGSFDTFLPVLRLRKVIYREGALGDAAMALYRARPDAIDAKTGLLRRVGHFLRDEGLEMTIRTGFLGEVRTDACRKDIVDLFHMERLIHTYGASEFGFLGSECTEEAGIHLSADSFIFEYLGTEEVASPGERGEIVVTGLDNEAMPLIRYRLGDIVVPADDDVCGCGSPLPRLKEVDGRREDRLLTASGESVSPGLLISYLEDVLGLRDFQVVQKARGKVLVTLLRSQYTDSNLGRIRSFIVQTLGGSTTCEFDGWEPAEIQQRIRPVVGPH